MKTAKVLFWVGIAVIIVQLAGNMQMLVRMVSIPSAAMPNWGTLMYTVAGSFVGGER